MSVVGYFLLFVHFYMLLVLTPDLKKRVLQFDTKKNIHNQMKLNVVVEKRLLNLKQLFTTKVFIKLAIIQVILRFLAKLSVMCNKMGSCFVEALHKIVNII